MPSPIGHALAGVVAAWAVDLLPGDRSWRTAPRSATWFERAGNGLTLVCIVLAVAPDLDLFFSRIHRTVTHSYTASVFVGLLAALWAAGTARPVMRVALMCACAHWTHVLLDWLGADRYYPFGIQLLWPFSSEWFISPWTLFAGTERRDVLGRAALTQNAFAAVQEIVVLAPIVVGLWLVRIKALAGLSAELPRRHHPPK